MISGPTANGRQEAAKYLGYLDSPNYFDPQRFSELPHSELRYACRKATETLGLRGVYLLRDTDRRNHVPVIFYCVAATEHAAHEIHRRAWNLNLVPFLLIETPTRIRAYQGFSYEPDHAKDRPIVDAGLDTAVQVLERLAAFRAEAIDRGQLFDEWAHKITPETRVNENLLRQLRLLDRHLRRMRLSRDASHCLIGKYVWLSYLRDRKILSDWRLSKAGARSEDVFGRNAKLSAFHRLDDYLQSWLNGEVFPLVGEDRRAVKAEHLQKVAGIFAGDEANGQMALFTELYDFAHVPIETLSIVYEQFLHHKEQDGDIPLGKKAGAYYTPLSLAEFMIEEMDRKLPLADGVGVFDPACGSGAFLVQAYRRLVERMMDKEGRNLRLAELRALLKDNIFGVDRDADACRVARMSLAIGLLDYADPPDVSGPTSQFQLPALSDRNILQKDFFDLDESWPRTKGNHYPRWVIGNPPWLELRANKRAADVSNRAAWKWFDTNQDRFPTSGNQVAEAFVWQALNLSGAEGIIGLVVPAMTLFKHEAQKFRQKLFSTADVWSVANFANLAYVLFSSAERPAACFFYRKRANGFGGASIPTFAPLVVDQGANLPAQPGAQLQTWNIIVRPQDWREVDRASAATGERLVWKLAMWGSHRDATLLKRLANFPTFSAWRKLAGLVLAAGPELRSGPSSGLPLLRELIGKRKVSFAAMRGEGPFFTIPEKCLSEPLTQNQCYLRRGEERGLEVCKPPHLIVNKGRRFAVFSDEFLVIPPGENGIHGEDANLLKALGLYLISAVARWHQFFLSSEWGISTSIARLDDLECLPIPFRHDDRTTIDTLAALYDAAVRDEREDGGRKNDLLREAEVIFRRLLKLRPHEIDLIDGFFAGPYECIKGKFPAHAISNADFRLIRSYCTTLRRELDDYIEGDVRHKISAMVGEQEVWLKIEGERSERTVEPTVQQADPGDINTLRRISGALRTQHSQYVYFEKALSFYDNGRMYFLKPRRSLEWNVRQAILDADELIAELLIDRDVVTMQ